MPKITLEELRQKITEILSHSSSDDWIWDGVDETKVSEFDAEKAASELVELFKQYLPDQLINVSDGVTVDEAPPL